MLLVLNQLFYYYPYSSPISYYYNFFLYVKFYVQLLNFVKSTKFFFSYELIPNNSKDLELCNSLFKTILEISMILLIVLFLTPNELHKSNIGYNPYGISSV